MRPLSPDDDRFHPAESADPMWTETTWWGFSVPERQLGGMVYSLFRPNLGIAALVTQVWDADAVEPWRAPYARSLWHLRLPEADLDDMAIGPLHLRAEQPLRRYRLVYDDGDHLQLDITAEGTGEPNAMSTEPAAGHFDQLCRFEGTIVLGGEKIGLDCFGMRDRSWYVRDDMRSSRAGYTYGAVDAGEHFLVYSLPDGDEGPIFGGYLVRDGAKAAIVGGRRRIASRRRGHPDDIEIEAADGEGRTLYARGQVDASLASQSTPGMFSWMSTVAWDLDGRGGHGEDHDVWSPDLLAHRPAPLTGTPYRESE